VNGGHGGFKATMKTEGEGTSFWDPFMEATRAAKTGAWGQCGMSAYPFGATLVALCPVKKPFGKCEKRDPWVPLPPKKMAAKTSKT